MHNKIRVNGVLRQNDLAIIIIGFVNKYEKDCEKLCAPAYSYKMLLQ